MKAMPLIRIMLLALVAASLVTWSVRTWRGAQAEPNASAVSEAWPDDGVVVINFHGATRCDSCREIGRQSQAVVEREFRDAVRDDRMTWRVINFDEPAHRHFVEEFGLVSSTVVIIRREHGRDAEWRRLDDVWEHVFDPPVMGDYLRREIVALAQPAPTP